MAKKQLVDSEKLPPTRWESGNRLIQPHRIGFPITMSDRPSPTPRRYYTGPVHPILLRIEPGNARSLDDLRSAIGIDEFLQWTYERGMSEWTEIAETMDATGLSVSDDQILTAWRKESTVGAVAEEVAGLRAAFDAAEAMETFEASQLEVVNLLWDRGPFKMEFDFDAATQTIFERPWSLWDRAWLELLDGIRLGRAPIPCRYCNNPFVPGRRGQWYCKGTNCQSRAYERRRGKRTAYNTERQRRLRKRKAERREE